MNPQQLEKVKKLVNRSNLLTTLEKQEWLDLLEVMNDKQAFELSRILESGETPAKPEAREVLPQQPVPVLTKEPPVLPVVPKQSFAPVFSALPKVEPQRAKPFQPIMPAAKPSLEKIMHTQAPKPSEPEKPLSPPVVPTAVTPEQLLQHMNLQKLNFKPAPVVLPPVLKELPKRSSPASKSGFFSRLKSILREKDLPSGHPEFQLELNKPEAQKPAEVAPKKEALPPKPALPEVPRPQPKAFQQVPSLSSPGKDLPSLPRLKFFSPSPLPQQAIGLKLPDMPEGRIWKGALSSARLPHLSVGMADPAPKQPQAGKIEYKPESKEQLGYQIIPQSKPDSQASDSRNFIPQKAEDASNLSPFHLDPANTKDLSDKFVALVGKAGYFSVMANLEKSSAYKAYMQTGAKMLETNNDFTHLEPAIEKYLTQKQFEVFVDLLMEIQG